MRGTIKWYSAAKGFGWITLASGEEVYVHSSALRSGFGAARVPRVGAAIEADIIEGPGGKQAIRVLPAARQTPRRPI